MFSMNNETKLYFFKTKSPKWKICWNTGFCWIALKWNSDSLFLQAYWNVFMFFFGSKLNKLLLLTDSKVDVMEIGFLRKRNSTNKPCCTFNFWQQSWKQISWNLFTPDKLTSCRLREISLLIIMEKYSLGKGQSSKLKPYKKCSLLLKKNVN